MYWEIAVTILMFLTIIVLLLKGVAAPGTVFIAVPVAASLLMGYSLSEINDFVMTGLGQVSGTIFLMVMAVMYFSMLHEAGVFNFLVTAMTKRLKNSVISTIIVAQIISLITQLDGSGATTAICTITSMRPVFEKQKISREALMLILSLGSGILLILPYMPGLVESASYVGLDPNEIYNYLLPVLIFGLVLFMLCSIPIAWVEKRRGAGMSDKEFAEMKDSLQSEVQYPMGKGVALFDGIFTLFLLIGILLKVIPTNVGFGLGFFIMLFVNYRTVKEQTEYISRKTSTALNMAYTMLGIAVLVGVNGSTGALQSLAELIASNLPEAALSWLLPVICVFALPLSMVLGNALSAVIVPAMVSVLSGIGLSAMQVQPAIWVACMLGANLSLFNASPYLALGLAGVDIKDHLKYSFCPTWAFSVALVVFMIVCGLLPVG